jgi:hypothetical protein
LSELNHLPVDRPVYYWRSAEKPHARTVGVYWRAEPEDLSVLDGRDETQRVALLSERLKDWKSVSNA